MAKSSPRSKNGSAHVLLGLTVGAFSLLVASSAFAQYQPGYPPQYPPQSYPQPYPPPSYPQPYPPPSYPPPGYYQGPPLVYGPPYTRGLLFMPYIGFATPVGGTGDNYDTGLRIGTLLGWHLNRQLSMNVEFTLDFLNPKGVSSEVSDIASDFSFSPLLHLPLRYGPLELIVGPKIGFFEETISYTINGDSYNDSYSGLMFGVNAGLLVGMGSVAIGGLFSYTGRHYSSGCETIDYVGNGCTYASGTFHTVSFNGVILF